MTKKITKNMTFKEAMMVSQMSGLIFLKHGMHCIGCAMANEESIEDGAKAHGLSDEDISKMIKEINEKINKTNKKQTSTKK
jgi:hybrid cluster-associated redox disulfide protein